MIMIITLFKCQLYLALYVLIEDTVNRETNYSEYLISFCVCVFSFSRAFFYFRLSMFSLVSF